MLITIYWGCIWHNFTIEKFVRVVISNIWNIFWFYWNKEYYQKIYFSSFVIHIWKLITFEKLEFFGLFSKNFLCNFKMSKIIWKSIWKLMDWFIYKHLLGNIWIFSMRNQSVHGVNFKNASPWWSNSNINLAAVFKRFLIKKCQDHAC